MPRLKRMAATHGVRKTVTVLFSDVAGSTALGERLDPEATRRVLGRYFDEARTVIERHGGAVEKFMGDAVMAVFGIPTVHEDDALRAVRAADELRAALEELNEQSPGVRLETRTGVNTGEVVAGDGEAPVVGDAVNVAARLEQSAAPGEILIGATTRDFVRDAIDCEPLEPLELKGKAERVPAWRLLRVIEDAPAIARRLDAALVGRPAELQRLRDELARSETERECRLVTIVGEAGIGKSRLTRELASEVGADTTVLSGRCLPYGEGITYWPLVDMLRRAAPDGVERLLEGREDADWIAERIGAAVGDSALTTAPDEIVLAVRRLFEHLARQRALVVEVDDIHWAEPRFLELVETVALLSRGAPILLLCLARPELLERRPDWPGVTLRLGPLTPAESTELISGLDPLPDDARARIAETAAGNPLFLEQMAALAAQERKDGALTVPPSIEALLAARLDLLEPEEQAAIERAAVVGHEFWSGAVSSLSADEAQVGSALLGLARRQLVRPHETGLAEEDGFRFAHLLVRDAAYRRIPKELRGELHERFADWTEARDRERGSRHDELVGYHLEQAYRYREELGLLDETAGALAERAAAHLASAGERAFARGDMAAVASLVSRARSLSQEGVRRDVELTRMLTRALWETGDLAGSAVVLEEAGEFTAKLGDRRLQAHVRLGVLQLQLNGPAADLAPIRRELTELLDVFEAAEDDLGLATTWVTIGQADWLASRAAASEAAYSQALAPARRAGDRWLQLRILSALPSHLVHGPTPVDQGIRGCEELLGQAEGAPLVESSVLRALARLHAMQGDFERARAEMSRGNEILDELGHKLEAEASRGHGTTFVEMLSGDLEELERALRRSHEALDAMGEKGYLSTVAAILGTVLVDLGRLDEAERFVEASRENASQEDVASQVGWRWGRARVLARRGDVEAEAVIREALEIAERTDFPNLKADTLVYLAEVLQLEGRADEAAVELDRAVAIYKAKGNVVSARNASAQLEKLRAGVSS
jgi:class 3 adenylate cyclase/tetratricopeptide (TPR) repeat protein